MKRILKSSITVIFLSGLVDGFFGCSSIEVKAPAPQEDNASSAPTASALGPEVLDAPHPVGLDLTDLKALFSESSALTKESLEGCEEPLVQLLTAANHPDDMVKGARELVQKDPLRMHWCFYRRLLDLQLSLQTEPYIDVKQKKTLDTYGYLVPLANAFLIETKDSRYLRWAVRSYQRISEWVFYRKLELSPAGTSQLVEVENPYAVNRGPAAITDDSVFKKYQIKLNTPMKTNAKVENKEVIPVESKVESKPELPVETPREPASEVPDQVPPTPPAPTAVEPVDLEGEIPTLEVAEPKPLSH